MVSHFSFFPPTCQFLKLKKSDHLPCKFLILSVLLIASLWWHLTSLNLFSVFPINVYSWGLIRFSFDFLVEILQRYLCVLLIVSHWETLYLSVIRRLISGVWYFTSACSLHSKFPRDAVVLSPDYMLEHLWSIYTFLMPRSHFQQLAQGGSGLSNFV